MDSTSLIGDLSSSNEEVINRIAEHYKAILELCGENTDREGLVKTPLRAAKAIYFLSKGYRSTVNDVVGDALFESEGSGMVIVKDIEFYSLCEHHLLPFFGSISVGYMPAGKILGISKIARIVDLFARRFQVQERLTSQICKAISEATGAAGVIVSCKAEHLCMKMRGVEKHDSSTVTVEKNGIYISQPSLQKEFLSLIKG